MKGKQDKRDCLFLCWQKNRQAARLFKDQGKIGNSPLPKEGEGKKKEGGGLERGRQGAREKVFSRLADLELRGKQNKQLWNTNTTDFVLDLQEIKTEVQSFESRQGRRKYAEIYVFGPTFFLDNILEHWRWKVFPSLEVQESQHLIMQQKK